MGWFWGQVYYGDAEPEGVDDLRKPLLVEASKQG